MTGQEIRAWLKKRPFQPFQITMDNGESFDVVHPEFTFIAATGALYVFQPVRHDEADVAGPQTICELRNISTLKPLPSGKRSNGRKRKRK